ncbi:quinone oxidoreductase family protein [Hymenobacter fodinae]|uniref:Zinc-binding alcohol dehydrogenase family protein n=1 Tax=Hymenobacter fodinae TaxID=2510796 RepID=A0A4Z0P026_9BACT|nr:zinc-binding alcohol dehydrogenase family protein [Hymenobacter fodinae]TGE03808.1 zinc-binding alcohol dehydrogenase family protein [Hymenobacter fodinae]
MKVVQYTEFGDYDRLQVVEAPAPQLAPGQMLVRMTAAAVNPVDDFVRRGLHRTARQLPHIPGNEGVGIVVTGTADLPAGTRVLVLPNLLSGGLRGVAGAGTWQELLVLSPAEVAPAPAQLSDEAAAGFSVAYLSAQLSLEKAGFKAGHRVLALGIGGAVGNAAVQLARAQGAAQVISTAGSSAKAEQARQAGYEHVIDLSQESLTTGVARLTDGAGVDVVVDSLGGTLTGPSLSALRAGGSLVVIGYAAGTEATVTITDFVWKKIAMYGTSMGGREPGTYQHLFEQFAPLVQAGALQPLFARSFPLAEVAEAQRYLQEERPFGKVVLTF